MLAVMGVRTVKPAPENRSFFRKQMNLGIQVFRIRKFYLWIRNDSKQLLCIQLPQQVPGLLWIILSCGEKQCREILWSQLDGLEFIGSAIFLSFVEPIQKPDQNLLDDRLVRQPFGCIHDSYSSTQFSKESEGMRSNSLTLLVTNVQPSARAWAVIQRSLLPMGVPRFSKNARIRPYWSPAAGLSSRT